MLLFSFSSFQNIYQNIYCSSSLSFKGKPAFQQEVALERVIYDTSCLESASGGSVKRRGMKAVEGVSAFHAEVPLLGIGASGAGKQTK